MIGLFARLFHRVVTRALPEPTLARRRLDHMQRSELIWLLQHAHIYPPGMWSATADGLRGVAVRAYEEGKISDELIEETP